MAKILSLQVSDLKTIEYRGREITTGFFKRPVQGSRYLGLLGLDGDRQADLSAHGGSDMAVYLYPWEHYMFWAKRLGRTSFPFGQFGENLTTLGLLETDTNIGDVFSIGGAVIQITQPRVPCFKLTMAMEAGGDFANRFMQERRVGFYARVLEPGSIEKDHRFRLIEKDPAGISVSEYIEASQFSMNLALIRRCRAIRPLPRPLKKKLDKRRVNALAGEQQRNWQGFEPCKIVAIAEEGGGVRSITMRPVNPEIRIATLPGQCVTLQFPSDPRGSASRPYTISGSNDRERTIRVSVKNSMSGPDSFSAKVHGTLCLGDIVNARGPSGHFILDVEDTDPILLIAAGIGVTPMLAMAKAQRDSGVNRPVRFIYGVRDAASIALMEEIEAVIASIPGAKLYVPVSSMTSDVDHPVLRKGRADAGLLREAMDSLMPSTAIAYMCGPGTFCGDLRALLVQLGLDDANIHQETFLPPKRPALISEPAANATPPLIRFAKSKIELIWDPDAGSILDLAENAGIAADFACRAGTCETCAVKLEVGEVDYTEVVQPSVEGTVLICCAVPKTDVTVQL